MTRFIFTASLLLALFVPCTGAVAQVRRWVLVDERPALNPGLGFISNHEGYERVRAAQQGAPQTTFQVGGNFTNFLANVQNGDELIIIVHGNLLRDQNNNIVRFGFTWAGASFMFFGNNGAQFTMPVPANFNQLQNVTATICACTSARDPDGNGPETSLTAKLRAMMGAGCTVNGFQNLAVASNSCSIGAGGTNMQRLAAYNALKNNRNAWNRQPPRNRPGTGGMGQPANQLSAGQAFIDAAIGANIVAFDLPAQIAGMGPGPAGRGYRVPREGPPPMAPGGPTDALEEETFLVDGCESNCNDDECGNAYTTLELDETVPVLVSLVSSTTLDGHIALVWKTHADEEFVATVFRAERPEAWQTMGMVSPRSDGSIEFVDDDLMPGRRYGYMLGIHDSTGDYFAGETWLDAPAARLPLSVSAINPARGGFRVSFALPAASSALLQVFDVRGRMVLQRDVTTFGAGAHVLELDGDASTLSAGSYMLRVSQQGRVATTKVTLVH